MKIGVKTSNLMYDGPGKIDFDVVEIKGNDPSLKLRAKSLVLFKDAIKKKDVSMHTQLKRVFSDKSILEIEVQAVKLEILLCKYFGIKEYIFHLKQEKLTGFEKKIFSGLLKFAKKNGVEIIYESNGKFIAKTSLDILKSFPRLNYNLDVGHLNTAIHNKTLGMSVEKFVDLVRSRIVYLHLHNNSGEDDHLGLDEGDLDWKSILDRLDFKRIKKIILEVNDFSKIEKSIKLVKDYLGERGIK